MPSLLSHPAVPVAIGLGLGSASIPPRLLLAGIAMSIVPDADVYLQQMTSSVGHRGITHTIAFALVCAALAAAVAQSLRARRATAFWFIAIATLSHGLLDACTTGGAGIPFFWPLSDERYFMPFRMVEVSPIGIAAFFSARGLTVIASELKWIWLPAGLLALGLCCLRGPRAAQRA